MSDTRTRMGKPRRVVLGMLVIAIAVGAGGWAVYASLHHAATGEPTRAVAPSRSTTPVSSPDAGASTVLLTGSAIVNGDNLREAGYASARVSSDGERVTAQVCASQEPIVDPMNCTGASGNHDGWLEFTGTRMGSTARVSADPGQDPRGFHWATITFAGPTPNDAAIAFVAASGCERLDKSFGKLDDRDVCR